MGLDMYLKKKIYVGAEYEHRKVTGVIDIKVNGKPLKVDFKKVSSIEERVGYWRKANQIHKWFVDNVQEGKDDCGEYYVSVNQLKDLLAVCNEIKSKCKLIAGKVRNGQVMSKETNGKWEDVIEDGKLMQNSHVAAKLLPSGGGFFFGSTDYDQYYMADIDGTIEILEGCLKDESGDYYYQSSW